MYSPTVQRLIRRLNTPPKVQAWLRTLRYHTKDTMRTLPDVVRTKSVHCLEAAMAAATILEHHGPAPRRRSGATTGAGYPPLLLDLDSKDGLGHVLFLYRRNGRYGTVGMSRDIGLYGRKPVYRTIRSLVQSYAAPYIDSEAHITKYGVLDLRTLPNGRWRDSRLQVWYVERALIRMPHHRFVYTIKFINTWRNKYVAFRTKFPDRLPTYFPNRRNWL